MSETEKFQQDRWSLFITFDPLEVQRRRIFCTEHLDGDVGELHAHMFSSVPSLRDEYDRCVRTLEDGTVEVTCEVLDWLCEVMDWVTDYTVPREVRLVRNAEI